MNYKNENADVCEFDHYISDMMRHAREEIQREFNKQMMDLVMDETIKAIEHQMLKINTAPAKSTNKPRRI